MRYLPILFALILIAGCSNPVEPTPPKVFDGVILDVSYHFENWHENPFNPDYSHWDDLYIDVKIYQSSGCDTKLWVHDNMGWSYYNLNPVSEEPDPSDEGCTIYHYLEPGDYTPVGEYSWKITVLGFGVKGSHDNRTVSPLIVPPAPTE